MANSPTDDATFPDDTSSPADAALDRLKEAERRADETLESATARLEEITKEQEEHAERLRKEAHEPVGPLMPPPAETP